jgi:pimeloyl-ACP methyl ester carboxylesterase
VTKTFFQSLHVKGPDADARADYLYLNMAFGMITEDHPLAGYWADTETAREAMKVDRFGMRAGVVFRAKYFDKQGNLTYSFVENTAAYNEEVLFLSGEHNQIIGPEYQRDQIAYFPEARLEIIPDTGHNMFNENPDYTFAVIRNYLDQ